MKFQPGATQRGKRRLLAWNDHGCLKLVISSSRQRLVEVNYFKCWGPTSGRELKADAVELGALGPGVCALASASHVAVHLAVSWTQNSFEHHLAFGERIEALAISRSFVAIFVSPSRLLRLFTLSFIPLGVLAMPMDIVSMVASDQLLFCVFQAAKSQESQKLKSDLSLHFSLFDVGQREKLATGRLPVSRQSMLRWIGFDGRTAVALDSAGILRAMVKDQWVMSLSPSWVPIAELDGDCNLLKSW